MTRSRDTPVWKGPEEDGITSSLINRFLGCRERFRLYVVEGLAAADGFNHRLEYGNLWHKCEEALAKQDRSMFKAYVADGHVSGILNPLRGYAQHLCHRYPTQQEQIDHWYRVCKAQFPHYVEHWRHHKDMVERKPLLQEYAFKVQYKLPSGRIIWLRGKWDSVDLVGKANFTRVVLMENKTKGDVNETAIRRQLRFDCQTMLYLVALKEYQDTSFWNRSHKAWRNCPVGEVRYNVVRRPLSGGRHSIVRHKAKGSKPEETKEHFYARLSDLIRGEPEYFFMRWDIQVTDQDVRVFKTQFLDPVLEQVCDWWDWIGRLRHDPFDTKGNGGIHWRHPYGLYNVLDEGGQDELDEHLATGSLAGLTRVTTVFPELDVAV